ncbi:MAG: leucyl aminopeptidase [Alphaproteobacteria bacterium]|nr:MAG: leucyl aminopeptidase [Alphaproteobacteria bacterium]
MTSVPQFLTCTDYDAAIPLHMISREGLTKWRKTLSPAQARWAEDNGFKGDKNDILRLAGDEGQLVAVAIGKGSIQDQTDPWLIASLARSLPEGSYHLTEDKNPKLNAIIWALSQYKFDRYLQNKSRKNAVLVLKDQENLVEVTAIVRAITLVRDLINTPTCDMGPSHLSAVMQDLSDQYGASFNETVGDDLLKQGYNTIHAVGRAAANQPRLLDMVWGRADAPKITLVGKGVCFDTGGLDIKPSAGMRIMKKDMGGAAHTLGLAQLIMESGLDVRLRLLIPAVENNISSDAFRPGDIITTYKGTTVEVDNTDAEGRLVLCDALALASEEDPDLILDFATLTGAARVAMGPEIVPFFTDGDGLARDLTQSSDSENDPVWRMPLYAPYAPGLKSSCADLNNMGAGPYGGAIMAALFLKHFVTQPEKWVHFDVFAWNMSSQPGRPQGGEAMALRAVFSYLKGRFGT